MDPLLRVQRIALIQLFLAAIPFFVSLTAQRGSGIGWFMGIVAGLGLYVQATGRLRILTMTMNVPLLLLGFFGGSACAVFALVEGNPMTLIPGAGLILLAILSGGMIYAIGCLPKNAGIKPAYSPLDEYYEPSSDLQPQSNLKPDPAEFLRELGQQETNSGESTESHRYEDDTTRPS